MILVAGLFVASGVVRVNLGKKGMIVGEVTDALSGDPVHRAKIRVGGKSTIRYMDNNFKITKLDPGKKTIKIDAPGYESVAREVSIDRGVTRVVLAMKGIEIPGFDRMLIYTDFIPEKGIEIEVRFVDKDRNGIEHYPRLPMRMDVKLFERIGTEKQYRRGKLIYSGPVDLTWDSEAFLGKINGIIPWKKLSVNLAVGTYGVLDVVLHLPYRDLKATSADIPLT